MTSVRRIPQPRRDPSERVPRDSAGSPTLMFGPGWWRTADTSPQLRITVLNHSTKDDLRYVHAARVPGDNARETAQALVVVLARAISSALFPESRLTLLAVAWRAMEAESMAKTPQGDVERYHAAALELADAARRIVGPALERGFGVETKPDQSLVTDIDYAVERHLRALIGRWFPDHGILGEEYPPTHTESAFQWIMDPIDGTEEFVHGVPTFGTMVALHHRGVPLVGVIDHPALDIRVHAGVGLGTYRNGHRIRLSDPPPNARSEGIRLVLSARLNFTRHVDEGHLFEALTRAYPNHRIYRAAYAHTAVVTGAADAMVDMHNQIWDLAPSPVLVEEAGGRYVVVRDFPTSDGSRLLSAVFGKPAVVDRLLALFREGDQGTEHAGHEDLT